MTAVKPRIADLQPEADPSAAATHEPPMSQVTVTINNRQYRMACQEGQEGHLLELGNDLDQRIVELRGKFGEIGDARLTVMAALMVADELADIRERVRQLEQDLEAQRVARNAAADRAEAAQASVAATLNAAAERIEGIAKQLNSAPGSGNGVAMG